MKLKNLQSLMEDGGATRKALPNPVHDPEPWRKYLDVEDTTPQLPATQEPEQVVTIVNSVDELIPLALKIHLDILNNPLPHHTDENYVAHAKLKLATSQSIFSTQIKVDENILKKRKQDDIMSVLKELRDEEQKQRAFDLALEE